MKNVAVFRLLTLVLLVGLVSLGGCDSSSSASRSVLAAEETGITLTADPSEVVIDLTDPNTPTDPATGKAYGDTALTAVVVDTEGQPEVGVEVTFSSTAGTLTSEGSPVTTDDTGTATDSLRVFEDDPEEIDVSATVGDRIETITVDKTLIEPNAPPVADAGEDQTVECASETGATVTLDGSASTDPDSSEGTNDDIVLFEWFVGYGSAEQAKLGEGETLVVELPVGNHVVTLKVTDSADETDTDDVAIVIQDSTPPTISLMMDPSVLWPPNHRMVDVTAVVDAQDACGETTITLLSVTSSEPENANGDGNTEPDIMGAEPGSEDVAFQLRAERAGGGSGRVYTVRYKATDEAGNESDEAVAEVVVPHDRGH
jgi:hypothetical protein